MGATNNNITILSRMFYEVNIFIKRKSLSIKRQAFIRYLEKIANSFVKKPFLSSVIAIKGTLSPRIRLAILR